MNATSEQLEHLARRALVNIAREYPNHPQLYVESDADVVAPRLAHPAFFGCFDWHSAVHSHWLLVRAVRVLPESDARRAVVAALERSFEPAKLDAESHYLTRRPGFERPYGLAWALLLAAEAAVAAGASEHRAAAAARWSDALAPLAAAAAANLHRWLAVLRHPVRSGTHNQSAFALTLVLDAARALEDAALEAAARNAALAWYARDTNAPLHYEPSGEDFLSPALMEADLMRRVLPAAAFADWLGDFLPSVPARDDVAWLPVAAVSDETDGRAVHLHGLNLSRAWNLANIAAALPPGDARLPALRTAAARHGDAGLAATLATTHYAGDHWLPTFAVYLCFGSVEASR